ncbi:MAG: hypothetical protein UV80_C0002G0006 [Candidatus Peregrinibacteria bacterium GW2011_GWF2_43_17]|nr:MAG: hypothetical protein UV80_C0002G0006 [Candidatus Peregrinibacteria bacterium GW2011_GWF2_43_17]
MHITVFKNWRVCLAFIIMAIFVNYNIISAADDDETGKYGRENYGDLEDAISAYHENINKIFNDKLEIMVEAEDPITEPPSDDSPCTDENVSTYCVAESAIVEYMDFLAGLQEHAAYATDASQASTTISEMTEYAASRSQIISLEKEYALKALDMALAVYNEFQIMYPLHKEYQDIIKVLESYNSALADFRTTLAEWPSDFIDASTTDCK